MRFSLRFRWIIWLFASTPLLVWGQQGYEASWRAGLSAQQQNPASATASPYRKEIMFGGLSLAASNNLFSTNVPTQFVPSLLVQQLGMGVRGLPYLTNLRGLDGPAANEGPWNASHQTTIMGPGASWRLKTDPDWVERGLSRRVFSLRLERHEMSQINDLDASLIQPVLHGLSSDSANWENQSFQLSHREWDALAGGFGLSWGRGNHLVHLGLETKLLSAGSFMEANVHALSADQEADRQLLISADSIQLRYNPSFAEASRPGGQSRWGDFEYSFGYEVAIGLIYQHINYNREPKLEIGASVQGIGHLQYWNLTSSRYQLDKEILAPEELDAFTLGAEQANLLLQRLDSNAQLGVNGQRVNLPLRITSHAKYRLSDKWGIQVRADAIQLNPREWETFLRATLCWEKGKWGFFVPVSASSQADPAVGAYLSIGEVLVLGSNDLLTNLVTSANRQGVTHTHFFAAFRIPLQKEY
ncbi:MAG: DUF5723 family protein [Bacteroidota bacterium]